MKAVTERKCSIYAWILSLAAKDRGYKGVEIAGYLDKEPASIVEYERKREAYAGDLTKLHGYFKRNSKI